MGHIVGRKRSDGTTGYTAQIVIKKKGEETYREAKTFDRRLAAAAWLARREGELDAGEGRQDDPKLSVVIDRYLAESRKTIGKTKGYTLKSIKTHDIAEMRCSRIKSEDIIALARSLPVKPQTVLSYLSHLSPVFQIARPAWGYPLEARVMDDAMAVAKQLGLVRKATERTRRPTLGELDSLMIYFEKLKDLRWVKLPMQKIVAFAIFSTRRQDEICRIRRSDYEAATENHAARVMVRDMKHPGDKEGNDTWCELVPEAAAILEAMPKGDERFFPFLATSVSSAFTRACEQTGINTKDTPEDDRLHFHDLRHDGISRLFELGRNIPQAAGVSGHRSWSSLKRYTHVRQTGDKYATWKWRTP